MDTKLHQLGAEIWEQYMDSEFGLAFPLIFSFVPWRHHVEIITKCKDIDEALFYIRQTISEGWSRSTLLNCLHAKLYQSQGGAISNFSKTIEKYLNSEFVQLPSVQIESQASAKTEGGIIVQMPFAQIVQPVAGQI